MNLRLFAWVGVTNEKPRVRHYKGMPPELTGGVDTRKDLPWPRLLILLEEPDGGVSLDRYDEEGRFITDTWHQNVEEAKEQAIYEFKDLLSGWVEIPDDASDPVEYAINQGPKKKA